MASLPTAALSSCAGHCTCCGASLGEPPHRVDQFFRSFAQEPRHQAIGMVLSGTATVGTLGLEEFKAEGGITFAQDTTAQHEEMPNYVLHVQ